MSVKTKTSDINSLNDSGIHARKEVNEAKAAAMIRWFPFDEAVINDVNSILNKILREDWQLL